MVDDAGRDARPLTPRGIIRPAFGQKQPPRERLAGARHLVGAVQADRHLAVGRFAQCAAVLALHARRVLACLGKARFINDPVGGRRGGGDFGQPFQKRVGRPRTVANEVVQVLVALTQTCCHRLDALALAIQQKPAHVHARPAASFRAAQPRRQLREKTFQPFVQPLQLPRLHPPRCRRTLQNSSDYLTEYY